MATGKDFYSGIFEETSEKITREWSSFLNTAARMYKYPFQDQVMIYAQRPEATACASMELWNDKRLNRWINRGAKSIVLLDETAPDGIRRVFDVADTYDKSGANKDLPLWTLNREQHGESVTKALETAHGVTGIDLESVIKNVSTALTDQYFENNSDSIKEASPTITAREFRKITSESVFCCVCARCGLDNNFPDDLPLDYLTPETVSALGKTTNVLAKQVLSGIERTIKNEREKQNEREHENGNRRNGHNLSTGNGWGLSGSEHNISKEQTAEPIRTYAEGISGKTPADSTQRNALQGHTERTLFSDRRNGGRNDRFNGRTYGGERPAAGQSYKPDGMGTAYEYDPRYSQTNRSQRNNSQLKSLFDVPAENGTEAAPDIVPPENKPHIPVQGDRYRIKGRLYEVNEIAEIRGKRMVDLRDITFQGNGYIELFSSEPLEFIQSLSPVTKQEPVKPESAPTLPITPQTVDLMTAPAMPNQPTQPAPDTVKPEIASITDSNPLNEDEIDFDTVAKTTLERVMQDADYFEALINAKTRAELRNPCTWALEQSIRDHEIDEPNVYHAYFSDRDLKEKLFNYILRESYANRPTPDLANVDLANVDLSENAEINYTDTGIEASNAILDKLNNLEFQNTSAVEVKLGYRYIISGRLHCVTDIDGYNVKLLDLDRLKDPNETITQRDMPLDVLKMYKPINREAEQQHEQEAETGNILDYTFTDEGIEVILNDFRITDMNLGEGGAKTKYNWNIDAIQTLKQIEAERRPATPEEQTTLSRYVGWGGISQAFDDTDPHWTNEAAELKALLNIQEYESARASTLNAHYTTPIVIKAMYETIERMGFKSGNILEPACGVGNFIGMLPESMKGSHFYGVEIDSISGRIARNLYPNADIRIKGFEDSALPNNIADIAIGNIPFGGYKIGNDRIHDYFFKESIKKVRPGGVIAFVTSQGTMDKQFNETREQIAENAKFLGAVRLPNNAFKANAGTEVTTDIIFLQKRDARIDISEVKEKMSAGIETAWLDVSTMFTAEDNAIQVNRYYTQHPEMILGEMIEGNKLYGKANGTSCRPIEGAILSEQLAEALKNVTGIITESTFDANQDDDLFANKSIPADPKVRNNSYALVNDAVYFRVNSRMIPVEIEGVKLLRVKEMIGLRDCARELLNYQLDGRSDSDIKEKQNELNLLYDAFVQKHGLINSRANKSAFSNDDGYFLLASLEILDNDKNFERKADIFTKRTVSAREPITSVETSNDALAVSLAEKGRIDLGYMASLTGFTENKTVADLNGIIFNSPEIEKGKFDTTVKWTWVTADEYLSGNVREKLRDVQKVLIMQPDLIEILEPNIKALERVQPRDIEAGEITVRLGATWISDKYVDQFVKELLQFDNKNPIVNYSSLTNRWNVAYAWNANTVLTESTYGTKRMDAFRIIEETLNMRDVCVNDIIDLGDNKKKTVINRDETLNARQKQNEIKEAFQAWIWKDIDRRNNLLTVYNEKFNSIRSREFDGHHLKFPGINPEIEFRPHQLSAIARGIYSKNNTLLAHAVGAGKTYEMAAIAMESKRLGLCPTSLVAVKKSTVEQIGGDFLKLYPSANILIVGENDFNKENRKKLLGKIVSGDYDAIIISHEQLEKIPISPERKLRLLRDEVESITNSIKELKREKGDRFSIKQAESLKKSLEIKFSETFAEKGKKDGVIYFEELGIGKLIIDEAHKFKNMDIITKIRNVTGLNTTGSDRTADLLMKCRYMDEVTGGNGVVFSTGTPVSNSLAELYTLQTILQDNLLKRQGINAFDSWISTYGETRSQMEIRPEGGYRDVTRLARFYNLPVLMTSFKEAADIVPAENLNQFITRPEIQVHVVEAKPSKLQLEAVQDLAIRAENYKSGCPDPENDQMLSISVDARKIGLDMRLMNDLLPDNPDGKVNKCTENVFNIWTETRKDRLTQLVFLDFSTPSNKSKNFNLYDDIKGKLVNMGVPANEIAFIHDAKTKEKQELLFEKVRRGDIRILLGSTEKLGTGVNVQNKLIAIHDLDCPWRPSDLEQRRGRIDRQGNGNPNAHIYRYVTTETADAWLWETITKKQGFISQIMTNNTPLAGVYENIDNVLLEYDEIKALASGDPNIKKKIELDRKVSELITLKIKYQNEIYSLEHQISEKLPREIRNKELQLAGYKEDVEHLDINTIPNKEGFSAMIIGKTKYTEKAEAGKALLDAFACVGQVPEKVGEYRGFDIYLSYNNFDKEIKAILKGKMQHETALGGDVHGNITRINNALTNISDKIAFAEKFIQEKQNELESAKIYKDKPFAKEAELKQAEAELAEVNALLTHSNKNHQPPPEIDDESLKIEDELLEIEEEAPEIEDEMEEGIEDDAPEIEGIDEIEPDSERGDEKESVNKTIIEEHDYPENKNDKALESNIPAPSRGRFYLPKLDTSAFTPEMIQLMYHMMHCYFDNDAQLWYAKTRMAAQEAEEVIRETIRRTALEEKAKTSEIIVNKTSAKTETPKEFFNNHFIFCTIPSEQYEPNESEHNTNNAMAM